jgi:hypothetical protein
MSLYTHSLLGINILLVTIGKHIMCFEIQQRKRAESYSYKPDLITNEVIELII